MLLLGTRKSALGLGRILKALVVSLLLLTTVSAFAQAELSRKVKSRVSPGYPELARKMNIRGVVKLLVVVSPNGQLKETKVIGGNPILVNAAQDAVKKWKFEPAEQESSGTIEFRFQPAQ